jgi:DNA-binding transcriptional LysR family regulator
MRNKSLQIRTGELDWDDLRTVLAVARAQSLSGAARALGIGHSTVFRRINDIEERLGTRLFERVREGYLANAQGEVMAEAAQQMEVAALEAERQVLGADTRLQGVIRVASSELLSAGLLTRVLGAFLLQHPEIDVELIVANRHADLSRREADLALRATAEPPATLIGRELTRVDYAVYARRGAYAGCAELPALTGERWVGLDDSLAHLQISQWMRSTYPQVRLALRSDSLAALIKAVAAGIGIAALPRFAAAQDDAVEQISAPLPGVSMPVWLLSHPDSRGNARVRALSQFLVGRIPGELEAIVTSGACRQGLCNAHGRARTATPQRVRKVRSGAQAV